MAAVDDPKTLGRTRLSFANEAEIDEFAATLDKFERGELTPDQWRAYGDRSRTQPQHWFNGKTYTFEELVDARAESHFDQECTDEKFQKRFDACQKAIAGASRFAGGEGRGGAGAGV